MLDSTEELSLRLQYHVGLGSKPKIPQSLKKQPIKSKATRKAETVAEICFTGFSKTEKLELLDKAEKAGMLVRSSVTKSLDFICCGKVAGPAKIAKARVQGVIALDSAQFCSLIETAEVPI